MVIIAPVYDMPNAGGAMLLWLNNGNKAKEHIANMPKQILNGIGYKLRFLSIPFLSHRPFFIDS